MKKTVYLAVSEEVKNAVEVGYKIKKIFEIWQYKITQYDPSTGQGGLFPGYIDEFFKQKTLASGFPCNNNPQAMDQYIQDFERSEGVKLDKSQISLNPGKRLILYGVNLAKERICQKQK